MLSEICGKIPEIKILRKTPILRMKRYRKPVLRIANAKTPLQTSDNMSPWQGSFQHKECKKRGCYWVHICGTTLIHPSWSLTAAHCINGLGYDINNFRPGDNWGVFFGKSPQWNNRFNSLNSRTGISKIVVFPRYQQKPIPNVDLALLKTTNVIEFHSHIQPACLPKPAEPSLEHQETCLVSGYGYTSATTKQEAKNSPIILDSGKHQLLSINIDITGNEQCKKASFWYKLLNKNNHICAGNRDGGDTCEGDSGGPLVCERKDQFTVMGVTSFSFVDCGKKGHYGIYANVKTHVEWIRGILFPGDADLEIGLSEDDEEHTAGRGRVDSD